MSSFQFQLRTGDTSPYTNNGLTSNIPPSSLGYGYQGYVPPALVTTDSSAYGPTRLYLREAFDTSYLRETTTQGIPARINSPFRLVTNAGDKLSRQNYSCGGTSIHHSIPRNYGLKQLW